MHASVSIADILALEAELIAISSTAYTLGMTTLAGLVIEDISTERIKGLLIQMLYEKS